MIIISENSYNSNPPAPQDHGLVSFLVDGRSKNEVTMISNGKQNNKLWLLLTVHVLMQ